jgi:hypothetical protein
LEAARELGRAFAARPNSWDASRVSLEIVLARVDCRYELRGGDEVVATGHLNHEPPLEIGDHVEVGGEPGIVRTIEPLLGEHEIRLVVQLLLDRS